MKTKFLLVLVLVLVSCQDTDEVLSWKQKINVEVLDFEKTKVLESTKTKTDKHTNTTFASFTSKKSETTKYSINTMLSDVFIFNQDIYLINGEVVFSNAYNFSPYINKGMKNENTKCCYVEQTLMYFNSSEESITLTKKVDIKSREEYESAKKELEVLPFIEKETKYTSRNYNRLKNLIDDFSK